MDFDIQTDFEGILYMKYAEIWSIVDFISVSNLFENENYVSHAQMPSPIRIDESIIRVFFASRDSFERSHINSIDFLIEDDNFRIISNSDAEVLKPGNLGAFDEDGVYPSSFLDLGPEVLLYYIGWNKGDPQPKFQSSIGVATARKENLSFRRIFNGPIYGRSKYEPLLATSPFILRSKKSFHMFYVSGEEWKKNKEGQLSSRYSIKMIHSNNHLEWYERKPVNILELVDDETNLARPCVVKRPSGYVMYYSTASEYSRYSLRIARSSDLFNWNRDEKAIRIDGMENQNMTCYPSILSINNVSYMFLNGSDYGKQGFFILKQIANISDN